MVGQYDYMFKNRKRSMIFRKNRLFTHDLINNIFRWETVGWFTNPRKNHGWIWGNLRNAER